MSDPPAATVNVSVPSALVDFFADDRTVVIEIGGVAFEGLMPPSGIISFPVPDTVEPGPLPVTLLATLVTGDSLAQRCSGLILSELPAPTPTPTAMPTRTREQEAGGVADEPARIEGSRVADRTERDESASGPERPEIPDTGQAELLLTGVFLLLGAAALGLGRYRSTRSPHAR